MGSIEQSKEIRGTFTFAVDVPVEDCDPWSRPYGKAPDGLFAKTVKRTFPLQDCRENVLGNDYSISKSRAFLTDHGFTVVRHSTALHQSPYGQTEHFRNADLMSEVYYPEIEQLLKEVLGCSHVFITDSLMRLSDAERVVTDSSWQKTKATSGDGHDESNTTRIHKASPTPPTRLPHWDFSPLGARQTIRNWSEEIAACARKLGIIAREDDLCAPQSAIHEESNAAIAENYDGPRYACFSVWRPLRTVTRDPLAMAPYRTIENDPHVKAVSHRIKQPGAKGDWLRDLHTLKVTDDAVEGENVPDYHTLRWFYVSNQAIDEVLLIKSFDSAALPGLARVTGEAQGVAHASPELGSAAHGEPRESVEVRLVAFW